MVHRPRVLTLATLCLSVCLFAPGDNARSQTGSKGIPTRGAVDAYILGPRSIIAGSKVSYRVAVHWAKAPGVSGPLPGAAVNLTLHRNKQRLPLGKGTTDATGSAHFRFQVPKVATGAYQLAVAVTSSLGKKTRQTTVQVFPGGRVLLTTDKKLYQPTQTIHIRALALRSIDLQPVALRPIKIQIQDPKGNVVFSGTDKTSRFGVASLDFQLADEINLGDYTIEAWASGAGEGGHTTRQVEVKRYILPKFKVRIETDRQYYRPGDTVRGTIRSDYFFGKPVAHGRITLSILSDAGDGVTRHKIPSERTDAAGRFTFAVALPKGGDAADGEVRILARVRDGANQLERADRSLPLTARPLRVSMIPENNHLVPGVHNRVHVIAGYPDGTPAVRARVTLRAGQRTLHARTDSLGVATFTLRPRPSRRRCPHAEEEKRRASMSFTVRVKDRLGHRGLLKSCLAVAPRGSVLVAPVRSLIDPGQPVEVKLRSVSSRRFTSGGRVFLDVVKAGQTIATLTQILRRGRASFRFEPDAALFGLLELRGYRISSAGERVGTSRLVYVDHPGQLRIKATADKSTYRPGDRARVHFQVTDSRTGAGVQAALGVLAIDEAVVALGGLQQSSPKLFFTLASQVQSGELDLRASPGGRSLDHWIMRPRADASARRSRAADVLLAALRPAEAPVWETNPWRERREAWEKQAPELISAAVDFMKTHTVGRKTAKGWRFDPELVPRMAAANKISRDQANDPWRRIVRPWHLRQTDSSFVFNRLAPKLGREQLRHIYEVLAETWKTLKLPRERMRRLPREQWPLVLPPTMLAALVKVGRLKASEIIDPWGKPYGVVLNRRVFLDPYDTGLVSRHVIRSAGPDGKLGNRDDIRPAGQRLKVTFDKDGALTLKDEGALGQLIGGEIGEAYGVGGLGLAGNGGGGGGTGEGTIGLGTLGTIGHGGGGMPARVRSVFPETLLWRPNVITDRQGRATVDFSLADSITDWRMLATGSSAGGLLGAASLSLRVFQEFFVDVELPGTLTQGDRISVPVTVYNYLKRPQKIHLQLKRASWFTPRGPVKQTIALGPSQVGVRYFPIEARRFGRQDLLVHARAAGPQGSLSKDAIRRTSTVKPRGREHAVSHSGTLRTTAAHELVIPAEALAGSQSVTLQIYPGPLSQTLAGLEGMLRMPDGCFEQISSATYPNVLVLDTMRQNGKTTPALEATAKRYINLGYQRLVGFEVQGGGFSMYGKKPADLVLTAYGLMEFTDMSRVHPVDPDLIRRTQRWLASHQQANGSWRSRAASRSKSGLHVLRTTSYITTAMKRSGFKGKTLNRAMAYVRRHSKEAKDAYTLALVGNLLAGDEGKFAQSIRGRLWRQRRASGEGLFFESPRTTLTYGAGLSGRIEATALAAMAFLSTKNPPRGLDRVIHTLISGRDPHGSWHSTQATIVALRALLMASRRGSSRPQGRVRVLVDGRGRTSLSLKAEDRGHRIDLTPYVRSGRHRVSLQFSGSGTLQYHLVSRYWLPHKKHKPRSRPGGSGLAITTKYNRVTMKRGDAVWLKLEVKNLSRQTVEAPLVTVSLPPGFTVDENCFTALVSRGKVEKVQRTGNRAILYLSRLKGHGRLVVEVKLRAKYPLKVQVRPSVVYQYYRPENRAKSQPHLLQVLP